LSHPWQSIDDVGESIIDTNESMIDLHKSICDLCGPSTDVVQSLFDVRQSIINPRESMTDSRESTRVIGRTLTASGVFQGKMRAIVDERISGGTAVPAVDVRFCLVT